MPRSIPLLPFFLSFLCALSPLATYIHTYIWYSDSMRPVSVAFLYSSFLFFVFFFCFRCRDRFRTVIGSISLNPPTPANARDQRWAQFSSPTPSPLAYPLYSSSLRCFDYLLGPDCVFFFSRDGLSSTCLSVRLSVSASLCSLQFCFSCSPYRSISPLLYFLLPSVFVPNAEVQRIISLSVCSPRIISAYHT